MLLDICLGTRTAWKTLTVFAEAPGKSVTRKEIKALTKLGNKTLSKILLLFEKSEVVTQNRIGKTYYYKLNLSNQFVIQLLEIIKLEKKELNAPDFIILNILRDFVYELTNTNIANLSKVILFGSYAKRTYTNASDIDIAVILKERNPKEELIITEITDRMKKRFGKEIQPHYYTTKEFADKKSKLVQEIIKDGIRLL